MVTLVVRLADLEFLSPHDLSGGLSTAELIAVIRKQFGYLPGEVQVEISDGVATIHFEEASVQEQTEARRLLEASTRRTALWYLNGATFAGSAFGPTLAADYSLVFP